MTDRKQSEGGSRKPSIAARHRARRLAVQALYQAQLNPQQAGEAEAQFRADHDFADADEAYFSAAVRGVLRDTDAIDALFADRLDRAIGELDPVERAILRLGAWEMRDRIDIPYRVVIDQAVRLCKLFGASESHRFINAVLDGVAQRLRKAETAAGARG